jgi:hypothetical protein
MILYGNQTDKALVFGKPQAVRGDEWIVNTQKTIAQKNNNFNTVNKNMGDGEDVSLLTDAPVNDWSVIFKPQNLGFFVLPFENAFSLRWWIMSYLLILSSYFFVLVLLPKKRLLASLLSLGFLFSPFFQWWYLYGTLGSVYYCLFGAVVFTKLLQTKQRLQAGLWSILLAYIAVCFILILYPPFQIPCALAMIAFAIGYFLEQRNNIDKKLLYRNLIYFICAIVLSLSIVGIFIYQKWDIFMTIQNTAYPGQRISASGGYDLIHALSSNLSPIFQSITRSNAYLSGATNQSESSNFILLLPFLFIPLLYLSYKKYRKDKKIDYILLSSSILLLIMLAWFFIPGIDVFGKFILLDKVPPSRLLIGLGLLNFIFIVEFVRLYSLLKERLSAMASIVYALLIVVFYLLLDFYLMIKFPGFIDYNFAVILSLPFAIIVVCFMRKYFILALSGLLLFTILSTFHINPIYRGLDDLTITPISQTIKEIGKTSNKKWVSEDGVLFENFATMNGEGSLNGVYLYPQFRIWDKVIPSNQKDTYNRYAHVNFNFDRNINETVKPSLKLIQADRFDVIIEPCDIFLKQNNVGFLITSKQFVENEAPCATEIKSIVYPSITFFVYRLIF